jgi:hypothetical protein
MDGSFSLLLGADANKREIRCNNQPLSTEGLLDAPLNANDNSRSAEIVQYRRLVLVSHIVSFNYWFRYWWFRLTSGFVSSSFV